MMLVGAVMALGFAPAGALLAGARQPLAAVPVALFVSQAVTTSWALFDLAALAAGALATAGWRR